MAPVNYDELFQTLAHIYEKDLPFNKLLGLEVETLNLKTAVLRIPMKPELVGNSHKQILHGGVISSVLDFAGGVIAQLSVIKEMEGATMDELIGRLVQMGTIDMRVDYIRPGRGTCFRATGELLRLGNKVAVVRSVFKNEDDVLIAAATGTYLVG